MICFDLIQIFEEFASLSLQVSWTHQFWTNFKNFLDFVFFPLGLSNFGWAAWFPFDKGQSKCTTPFKSISGFKNNLDLFQAPDGQFYSSDPWLLHDLSSPIFMRFFDVPSTWIEAEAVCRKHFGHLVRGNRPYNLHIKFPLLCIQLWPKKCIHNGHYFLI